MKMTISRLCRCRLLWTMAVMVPLAVSFGCTASASFGNRFVKPGEPAVSYDLAPGGPDHDVAVAQAREFEPSEAAVVNNVTLGTTLESTDEVLAAALLRVSMAPTVENHRLVAEAYQHAGITDHAYEHFRKGLKLDPCDSRSLEGTARLWRNWGVPELALSAAHRAVYCAPRSASAHNTLGTILVAVGSLQEATQAFETALHLQPRAAFALNNLCYTALQQGAIPTALNACRRALSLEPSMTAASTNLALVYALQGDTARAERQLLLSRDEGMALYNIGVLRMSLGQFAAAAEAFDRASVGSPPAPGAARRALQARARAAGEAARKEE